MFENKGWVFKCFEFPTKSKKAALSINCFRRHEVRLQLKIITEFMKKIFSMLVTMTLLISCSKDNDTTESASDSQSFSQSMMQRSSYQTINYTDAKVIAKTYTDTLSSLLDKIEDQQIKDENDAIAYANNYLSTNLQVVNDSVLIKLGYEEDFNYDDFSSNDEIRPDDIDLLDISDREKYYLHKLYDYKLSRNDGDLLILLEEYKTEVQINPEIESLSISFALIDVNRYLFLQRTVLKADTKCLKQAIRDGAVEGAFGMIGGAIHGGLSGLAVGLGNPVTGGAGAVLGAVGYGLSGFVSGAITGYVRCRIGY